MRMSLVTCSQSATDLLTRLVPCASISPESIYGLTIYTLHSNKVSKENLSSLCRVRYAWACVRIERRLESGCVVCGETVLEPIGLEGKIIKLPKKKPHKPTLHGGTAALASLRVLSNSGR